MRCLVIRGDDEVLRFPVLKEEVRLGSDPSNDVVVRIAGVSRFHARLVPDSVAVRLLDLGSKNGLVVKGKRFREVALLPGVVVQAGAATISLEDGATSDVELAVEFPVTRAERRASGADGDSDTETVTASAESADTVRFLRDLEKLVRGGRSNLGVEDVVERLKRLLGARGVVLLAGEPRASMEIVLSVGEATGAGLLPALAAARGSESRSVSLELGGGPAVWAPPACDGGLGVLVLLRPGAPLAPWQKDILSFGLEHLGDPKGELARQAREAARRRHGLVYPQGMVPGSSPAMRGLLGQIAKTVRSRVDVLILGETGTGKELIARMIHASGPTSAGPFVAINCASIPSELLESELFGVRARVATGVDAQAGRILEAQGGTLLLDEIGEMPLALQPKLLRFLQEREVHSVGASRPESVDVRVVSTSNRELQADVKGGRFRADLYYRLRGLQFHVPPLRDRKDDLAELVTAFASRAAAEDLKDVRGLSRKALELLRGYDWPGNVRELRSEVTRAVLFCPSGGSLTTEHFRTVEWAVRSHAAESAVRGRDTRGDAGSLNIRDNMDVLEKQLIEAALEQTGGNKSKAAEILGVTRAGLAMKVRRLLGKSDGKG